MMTRAWVVLIALLAGVPLAAAQPGPRGPQVDRREQVKKKIRAMRAYTLTEELALDDKTAAKLFPALARWDDVTDKLLQQRADIMRRVAAASAGAPDPKAVDKLIDEAVANQRAFWDLEEKRLVELRKILTPSQTARILVVLPAFERRIQNQLRRAIARRGAAGARGMRGVDRTLDDDLEEDDVPFDEPPRRRNR